MPQGSQKANVDVTRLELTRAAATFLEQVVDHYTIERLDVTTTSPARTVVDCFLFCSRVGLDTIAARGDYNDRYRADRSEPWKTAKFCRASTVMRAYIEVVV